MAVVGTGVPTMEAKTVDQELVSHWVNYIHVLLINVSVLNKNIQLQELVSLKISIKFI
jgi:hypothetical protein